MSAEFEVILVPKTSEEDRRAAIGEALMLSKIRDGRSLHGLRPMFIDLENPADDRS